jgi:hypothetical protein
MPFTRKLNACLPVGRLFADLAGLLACSVVLSLPICRLANSGVKMKQRLIELTATGIAPESHRTSLLTPPAGGDQTGANVRSKKNMAG